MDDGTLKIRRAEVLCIPEPDADALLRAGDGDAALLYIYILRRGGVFDRQRAARDLDRSDRDIGLAAERLRRAGLLSGGNAPARAPGPAQELPEYRAEDVVRPDMDSREFRDLVEAVQLTLGRILSSPDLKKLFGIYDELALPADVILLLVQHCKEVSAERYGREKNVGFAFIEKEAFDWFHREIMTYEQAEAWLAELSRRRSAIGQLQRQMGAADRPLSATERKYLNSWLELGFPQESIAMAMDRTVTNTGGLKWKYMDGIIQSWHRSGLHTPEEIEKGDKKPDRSAKRPEKTPPPQPRSDAKTMDQLKKLREKMKSGGTPDM